MTISPEEQVFHLPVGLPLMEITNTMELMVRVELVYIFHLEYSLQYYGSIALHCL